MHSSATVLQADLIHFLEDLSIPCKGIQIQINFVLFLCCFCENKFVCSQYLCKNCVHVQEINMEQSPVYEKDGSYNFRHCVHNTHSACSG